MTVGAVIVHWNQPVRCERTVQLFRESGAGVIVVDNGSSDAAIARLRAFLREGELIELGLNTGFGPAANVGLRHWLEREETELLVVAPHDARPQPGCLRQLAELLRSRPEVGLASADVGDGQTPIVDQYFGGISTPATVERGWEPSDHPHGTLMMARRDCLLDVGLFDERYFAYCEEADLGLRARRRGWAVGLLRGARVLNPTMRSGSAAVDYLQHRNTLMLVREHNGLYPAGVRLAIGVIELGVGMALPARRPPIFSIRGRTRGMVDFLRRRYGPPPSGYFERLDDSGDPIAASMS